MSQATEQSRIVSLTVSVDLDAGPDPITDEEYAEMVRGAVNGNLSLVPGVRRYRVTSTPEPLGPMDGPVRGADAPEWVQSAGSI